MNTPTARDGYDRYYLEKLWALVPEVYRNADEGRAFRELIGIIAEDAADVRRSVDRLWEDQHVETADDWAVPYLGQLVGTRLVSAQDLRARRVDVSNTIRFRRRRGTPELLETLTKALSGWDVVLEEGFRQLARLRHRLDGPAETPGFFTATPTGGIADLRRPVGAEIAHGPFGEFFHSLDTRRMNGTLGRFGVRKLNFHIYRLRAFEMTDVDPVEYTDPDALGFLRTYTFDPSGRALPLFLSGSGTGPDIKDAFLRPNLVNSDLREWQVVQPMRGRLLNHAAYVIDASATLELQALANPPLVADVTALTRLLGRRFESEPRLREVLIDSGASIAATPPDWYVALLSETLQEETGKAQLYPRSVRLFAGGSEVANVRITAGNLADVRRHPVPAGNLAEAMIFPEEGAFASVPSDDPADFEPLVGRYYYGFSGEVGAGPYPRPTLEDTPARLASDGVIPDGGTLQGDGLLIEDNRSYDLTMNASQPLSGPAILTVGPQRRPFVRLGGDTPVTPVIQPDTIETDLMIDGGWYAGQDPGSALAPGDPVELTLEGAAGADAGAFDFNRVEIRFATLDPGGIRADGVRIPALRLRIRARIRTLILRNAITGPIVVEDAGAGDPSVVDRLILCQSIVDASQTAGNTAIDNSFGRVILEGSTVFGDLNALRLDANAAIVAGRILVVNNQEGCFRFSATVDAPGRRLPSGYRHYVGPIPRSFFNSRRFGDPLYAQLSPLATPLAMAAENGSEIGVFSHLLTPIKLASIRAKVDEFGPVGQLAQYLFAEDPLLDAPFDPVEGFIRPPEFTAPDAPEPGEPVPFPPPLPPAPLPTSCPDDPDPDPDPDPLARTGIVALSLLNADLDGAPEFWRNTDWLPDENREISASAPVRPGIPFDKVDQLIEYDARLGTRPEAQGWQPNGPVTARYRIEDGALVMRAPGNSAPAFFSAQMPLARTIPEQVHAYAVIAPGAAGRIAPNSPEFFEVRKMIVTPGIAGVGGTRAGWRETADGLAFNYLSFEGANRFPPVTQEPRGVLRSVWQRLSMQSDFRAAQTLLSIADGIDIRPLGDFGRPPVTSRVPSLMVQFGMFNRRVGGVARLRNLVVSAPGRFVRARLRGAAPSDNPILRLIFLSDTPVRGNVTMAVRYSDDPDAGGGAFTGARVTGQVAAPQGGSTSRLDLPLEGVRAGRTLTLLIERNSFDDRDTLRGSLRLVTAALINSEGGSA